MSNLEYRECEVGVVIIFVETRTYVGTSYVGRWGIY